VLMVIVSVAQYGDLLAARKDQAKARQVRRHVSGAALGTQSCKPCGSG
jgi:hypothetical protein